MTGYHDLRRLVLLEVWMSQFRRQFHLHWAQRTILATTKDRVKSFSFVVGTAILEISEK